MWLFEVNLNEVTEEYCLGILLLLLPLVLVQLLTLSNAKQPLSANVGYWLRCIQCWSDAKWSLIHYLSTQNWIETTPTRTSMAYLCPFGDGLASLDTFSWASRVFPRTIAFCLLLMKCTFFISLRDPRFIYSTQHSSSRTYKSDTHNFLSDEPQLNATGVRCKSDVKGNDPFRNSVEKR